MIWKPDTCDCIIECTSPAVNGTYTRRCKGHKNSTDTREAYIHNTQWKFRKNRFDMDVGGKAQMKRARKEELTDEEKKAVAKVDAVDKLKRTEKEKSKQ